MIMIIIRHLDDDEERGREEEVDAVTVTCHASVEKIRIDVTLSTIVTNIYFTK
jgi:putative exporter of polyketide antibiotics